jgi:mRNA interferase RelE/StbE
MANWSLEFTREAEKDLLVLDKSIRVRIISRLSWLQENFDEILPTTLTANFRDYFKLRIGDWRIFYQVSWEKQILIVCYIDHRSKAYREK